MKISGLRREGEARVAATVVWENSDRPKLELFFETDPEFGADLEADPNAFLAAACFPAIRHGEERIALEGPISPELRDGLGGVAALFRSWYGEDRRPIRIESDRGAAALYPRTPPRAAAFLSGGIDSLFTLRSNRLGIPRDHPASIRDLVWLVGREFPGTEDSSRAVGHARRLRASLADVARDAGAALVPVRTNARRLEPDLLFFGYEFQGAYVASVAHVLRRRFDVIAFSSGWDLAHLIPWGTHPLVDPNLGTEAVKIRHEGVAFGRAEKLSRLADWDAAIRNLVVCNENPPGDAPNCGECYKCVETMTLLVSRGLFGRAKQFPASEVSAGMIANLTLAPNLRSSFSDYSSFWEAMVPDLEKRGREDLIRAIRDKLAEARCLEAWLHELDWKGVLKRADRRLSGGLGLRALRVIRRR